MLVIKIGGGAAIGEGGYTNFAEDLASIAEPVVVVHGGNAEFSELSRRLGMPPRMITSSSGRVTRYTDARDDGRHADGLLRQGEQAPRRARCAPPASTRLD